MVSGYRAQIKVPREFFIMILEFFIMTLECFHGSVISYFPSVDEMVLIARFCAKGRLYTLVQSLYAKIKNTTCCACDNLLIKPCRNRDDIILVLYVSFFVTVCVGWICNLPLHGMCDLPYCWMCPCLFQSYIWTRARVCVCLCVCVCGGGGACACACVMIFYHLNHFVRVLNLDKSSVH